MQVVELDRQWAALNAKRVLPPITRRPPSKQARRIKLYLALIFVDLASIAIGIGTAATLRFGSPLVRDSMAIGAAIMLVYLGAALYNRAYILDVLQQPKHGVHRAVTSLLVAVGTVLLTAFFLKVSGDFSRFIFGVGMLMSIALIGMGRFAFGIYARHRFGHHPLSEVLIRDRVACHAPSWVFTLDAEEDCLEPDIADPLALDRLGRFLKHADRVVIACPPERRLAWAVALKGASISGELLSPELTDLGAIGTGMFGKHKTLTVSSHPLWLRERAVKRMLDLAIACTGLIFFAPLMLLVAVAIKLESPGPIFFVQKRLGRGNRLFPMAKFRSMRAESCDAMGNRSTGRGDDRITRVGRFIRSSSIDELPQLFNVLSGDMSIVGPRPHALGSTAGNQLFWEIDHRYWHRHASKPGLTGLAQVRGYRGATHSTADLTNRLQADLEYQAGWTIWRDISILISTFRVLIHKNAF